MLYSIPRKSLSKYGEIIDIFYVNGNRSNLKIETVLTKLPSPIQGLYEYFLVQKRPFNNGRIESITLGVHPESLFKSIMLNKMSLVSFNPSLLGQQVEICPRVASPVLDVIRFYNGTFCYVTVVKEMHGRITLIQCLRQGQRNVAARNHNTIILSYRAEETRRLRMLFEKPNINQEINLELAVESSEGNHSNPYAYYNLCASYNTPNLGIRI